MKNYSSLEIILFEHHNNFNVKTFHPKKSLTFTFLGFKLKYEFCKNEFWDYSPNSQEFLKSDRIPTFQIDIFSKLVAISADHLILSSKTPSKEFQTIRNKCDFFVDINNLQTTILENNYLRPLRSYPQFQLN